MFWRWLKHAMKTYFYTFTLNKVDKYFIFILLCTCSTFAFVMFARGNGLALSLPCLIFPDERSDELTGRKQMCNLQPINLSFSLSLCCALLSLSLSLVRHTSTPTLHCHSVKRCLSVVVTIRNSLLSRSQKINMPRWISLTFSSPSSPPPWLSAEDGQKRFPLLYTTKQQPISSNLIPSLRAVQPLAFSCCDFSLSEEKKITRMKNLRFRKKKKEQRLRVQWWQDRNNEGDREVIHPTN